MSIPIPIRTHILTFSVQQQTFHATLHNDDDTIFDKLHNRIFYSPIEWIQFLYKQHPQPQYQHHALCITQTVHEMMRRMQPIEQEENLIFSKISPSVSSSVRFSF